MFLTEPELPTVKNPEQTKQEFSVCLCCGDSAPEVGAVCDECQENQFYD
jgi:hypothetical protein